MKCEYLVVGAGIFGSVIARKIADELDVHVLVVDKNRHIAGNCYSEIDSNTGIEYHVYGTHIFHASSRTVYDYISRFCELNGYYHQVLANYNNKLYQMPINLETINTFYNLSLSPNQAREFLKREIEKENITEPKNLEEKAISLIGKPLYNAFIKGYTRKQWGTDPNNLHPDIIKRLPVRYNYSENYFNDARWQGIPVNGFTGMIKNILTHPKIEILTNTNYFSVKDQIEVRKKILFTGPIDLYYNYSQSRLEWRSVRFEKEVIEEEDHQGTSVVNFTEDSVPFTRVHEPRHLHPEREYQKKSTLIIREYPLIDEENPYYPVNTERNMRIFQNYQNLALQEKNIIFGGRLGMYSYFDIDKAILAALELFENKILTSKKK